MLNLAEMDPVDRALIERELIEDELRQLHWDKPDRLTAVEQVEVADLLEARDRCLKVIEGAALF